MSNELLRRADYLIAHKEPLREVDVMAVMRGLAGRVRTLEAERECLIIDYQNEHKRAERAEAEQLNTALEARTLFEEMKRERDAATEDLTRRMLNVCVQRDNARSERDALRAAGTALAERLDHIGCYNCGSDDPRIAGSRRGVCKTCEAVLKTWNAALKDRHG